MHHHIAHTLEEMHNTLVPYSLISHFEVSKQVGSSGHPPVLEATGWPDDGVETVPVFVPRVASWAGKGPEVRQGIHLSPELRHPGLLDLDHFDVVFL